ncbi:MAG: alpha/beta fold hydrolase [Pseudomonadota bacterium]
MTVRRQYVDGPFGQIHIRHAGAPDAARPAVLCLHQSPKSGRQFVDLLAALGGERFAVAPDYPGMGESDPPPADPPVTVADYADSVIAVLDAFSIATCHVVGHHTGALVAAELATRHAERVLSIVSIAAPVIEDSELATFENTFEPIPIDEAGTRYTTLWQRVLEHRGPGMTLEMCAESMAENLRGGEGYEWGHRAAFAYVPTYRERLAALEHPMFVMNVRDDLWEITPRADGLLRNGLRRDYPDWGNGFLTLRTAEAAIDIGTFIARHDPA